jgi:hypothetical protein
MVRALNAAPMQPAQKNARTTIGMNLRSTRHGRPQRRKREAVEVVSCCAEDAAELQRARKPFRR